MMTFNGPAPVDIIYLKVRGKRELWSVALCEILYVTAQLWDPPDNCALTRLVKGKEESKAYTYAALLNEINRVLPPHRVEEFAILPQGALTTPSVAQLIEKYS